MFATNEPLFYETNHLLKAMRKKKGFSPCDSVATVTFEAAKNEVLSIIRFETALVSPGTQRGSDLQYRYNQSLSRVARGMRLAP